MQRCINAGYEQSVKGVIKLFFSRKCPYCKGKNLYLKRTSPIEVLGCRDCEKKTKHLEKQGLSKEQIIKIMKM